MIIPLLNQTFLFLFLFLFYFSVFFNILFHLNRTKPKSFTKQPNLKNEKKLKSFLKETYGNDTSKEEDMSDAPVGFQGEYHPYVFFPINIEAIK